MFKCKLPAWVIFIILFTTLLSYNSNSLLTNHKSGQSPRSPHPDCGHHLFLESSLPANVILSVTIKIAPLSLANVPLINKEISINLLFGRFQPSLLCCLKPFHTIQNNYQKYKVHHLDVHAFYNTPDLTMPIHWNPPIITPTIINCFLTRTLTN